MWIVQKMLKDVPTENTGQTHLRTNGPKPIEDINDLVKEFGRLDGWVSIRAFPLILLTSSSLFYLATCSCVLFLIAHIIYGYTPLHSGSSSLWVPSLLVFSPQIIHFITYMPSFGFMSPCPNIFCLSSLPSFQWKCMSLGQYVSPRSCAQFITSFQWRGVDKTNYPWSCAQFSSYFPLFMGLTKNIWLYNEILIGHIHK